MRFRGGLIAWALWGSLSVAVSAAPSSPVLGQGIMEAYGDSITAGFLSGTSLLNPPPLRGATPDALSISRLLRDMAVFVMTKDSALLARDIWPDLAWPVDLARIQASQGLWVGVRDLAVSGSITRELEQQVQAAPYNDQPTEAYFYIGHNDLCNSPRSPDQMAEDYLQAYSRALQVWEDRHQNSVAFILPLLDLSRVYDALHGYVWFQKGATRFTCESSWERYFPYCLSNAQRYRAKTLEAYLKPRVAAMNGALEVLAAQWDLRSHGRNRYYFLDGIYDQPIERKYFAVDCYHFSSEGQQAFARTVHSVILRKLAADY